MQMFIIVGMPRTGSTLLQTTLAQHPQIKMYGELFHKVKAEREGSHAINNDGSKTFFNEENDDAIDFLRKNVWNEKNSKYGAVGLKLFGERVNCVGTEKLYLRLKEAFPSLKFIHIERSDLLACWVSRAAAERTGQWVDSSIKDIAGNNKNVNDLRVSADPIALESFFQSYIEVNSFLRSDFFPRANYLHVDYEQFSGAFEAVSMSIFDFLGLPRISVQPAIRKQRQLSAQDQIQNIEDVRRYFMGTKYEAMVGKNKLEISDSFTVDDVNFEFVKDKYDQISTNDRLVVLKPKSVLEYYGTLIPQDRPCIIFEIGIFEAGSAIALALMNKLVKIIAIDIQNKPHLNDLVSSLNLQDRVKLYPNVSQDNESLIREIISKETMGNPIDLVIDDGSHMYELSKASFEIIFPYIRPNGLYIVEDWNWSHYPGIYQTEKWFDKPALTNLVFELVMLAGSDSQDIHDIDIRGISALIRKRSSYSPGRRFSIAAGIRSRGKDLHLI